MSRTPRHNPDVGYGRPMPWIDRTGGPSLGALDAARWQSRGNCYQGGTWFFFSDSKSLRARDAVEVCQTCPVRRACLAAALVYAEEYGVWGGITRPVRAGLLARLSAGETLGAVLDDALTGDPSEEVA